jgi:hypothetical protein
VVRESLDARVFWKQVDRDDRLRVDVPTADEAPLAVPV